MTISPLALGPFIVGNAAAALFTVPANATYTLTRAVVTNVTAGGVALTLWLVRSGGSRSNADILVGASAAGQTLSAGPAEPYVVNAMAGLVLKTGDAIHGLADTLNALNLTVSGWTQ